MFGEHNITNFLNKYKDVLGFNIELEWDNLRRKNMHVLIVNTGVKLKDTALYQIILSFCKEVEKKNFFKRIEFINLFPESDDNQEVKFLNEYWVLKLIQDTKNRRILWKFISMFYIVFCIELLEKCGH